MMTALAYDDDDDNGDYGDADVKTIMTMTKLLMTTTKMMM